MIRWEEPTRDLDAYIGGRCYVTSQLYHCRIIGQEQPTPDPGSQKGGWMTYQGLPRGELRCPATGLLDQYQTIGWEQPSFDRASNIGGRSIYRGLSR